MSDLVAQVLFTALALAVAATASVCVGEPSRPRVRGPYRALLAAGAVAGAALVLGAVAGAGAWRSAVVAAILGVVVLAFGPSARPWTLRGLLAWSLATSAGVACLVFVGLWMVEARLGLAAVVGGAVLWLVELVLTVLALGHVWELVDGTARWDWRRRAQVGREVDADPSRHASSGRRPFVSLHVPTHDEPPDLVIATLEELVALDYDDFEVLVVDDNTDEELWRPVERFCRTHEKLGFFHLEDRPGHKAGALNHALEKVDPRTELVGVVDADQLVEADFLSRCVPLFEEPGLAFVQTPPDHRDWEVDPPVRRLRRAHESFVDVPQRARNERNAATFGGTMGLVRRDALVAVGGWDEWCVAEDVELGLRLLRAGWSGTRVERSFGRGIVPLTFAGLKRQRFRRCFGGVQLLRLHWRALLPGRRTADNALTPAQRWSYLVAGLQWFGDLAGLLLTVFLLVSAVDVVLGDGLVVRRFWAPLVAVVVAVVVLDLVRSLALLRRTEGTGWREAVGALGLRLGLGWVVALASVRGLVAREGLPSSGGIAPGVRRRGIGPVLAGGVATAAVLLVVGLVGAPQLGSGPDGDEAPAATAAGPRPVASPASGQSTLLAVPLSPMATLPTTPSSPSPTARPAVAAPVRPAATRPTQAVTTPTAAPTSQPTWPGNGHGRPSGLPTPTRRPH